MTLARPQAGGTQLPFGVVTRSVSSSGHGVCIRIGGDIDIKNARFLERCVGDARAGYENVSLDLSQVTFLGSMGVRALVRLLDDALANQWHLEFTDNLARQVERMLSLTAVLPRMRMVNPSHSVSWAHVPVHA